MDAAVRTAYNQITGKDLSDPDIMTVRGNGSFRHGALDIEGKATVRFGVVHGMANAKQVLDEIREAKKKGTRAPYEFIEVMACRGGCIAGGGQPLGTDDEVRSKRTSGSYTDDKKSAVRCSHQNPSVKKAYDEYFGQPLSEKSHHLLHTEYKQVPVYKN